MSQTIPKWNEERTAALQSMVNGMDVVPNDVVIAAAEALETTTRSIASKLRKMNFNVESSVSVKGKSFTAEEEEEITSFLNANPATYTYAEVAANVCNGEFSAKKIQGKILSMELTNLVKATPKVETPKVYSGAEEAKITALVMSGAFIEDIAEAVGHSVPSVRGKILSISRTNPEITIPKQREYKAKDSVDPIAALGDAVATMSVEDIAKAINKTERGVKTMLTYRSLSCKDYNGTKKAEKIAENKTAV